MFGLFQDLGLSSFRGPLELPHQDIPLDLLDFSISSISILIGYLLLKSNERTAFADCFPRH